MLNTGSGGRYAHWQDQSDPNMQTGTENTALIAQTAIYFNIAIVSWCFLKNHQFTTCHFCGHFAAHGQLVKGFDLSKPLPMALAAGLLQSRRALFARGSTLRQRIASPWISVRCFADRRLGAVKMLGLALECCETC